MQFATQEYWDFKIGPFPLFATAFDREPLNPDEIFYYINRRYRRRAIFRTRFNRLRVSKLTDRRNLKQLESATWGMF